VQAEVRDGAREIEVEHARFHPRDPIDGVDVEQAVHLGRHDDERVAERGGTTRESGAAAAGDEGPAVTTRDADGRRDLLRRARPADRDRFAFRDARVTRVQRELERLRARSFVTECDAEVVEERGRDGDCRSLPTRQD
jgi:hypothetical protein